MLRNSLIAMAMIAASVGALAHDGGHVYGHVVSADPHFSISFASGSHHDGYRIRYETGGQHYWTHRPHHPGQVILVPRPIIHHVYHHKKSHRHEWREHHPHDRHHHHRY